MSRLSKFAFASIAACLSAGVQADTVCSKSMLRNSYGFSGTATGYTSLGGGNPVACSFGGILVFDANDGVTLRSYAEDCASTSKVLSVTNGSDNDVKVGSYTLNAATCTANIAFSELGKSAPAFAFAQIVFTDNGQSFQMQVLRDGGTAYAAAGAGTGSRL